MAAIEYQQILRELPFRMRIHFDGHPSYVRTLIDDLFQQRRDNGAAAFAPDEDLVDHVIAVLLIKAIIERIESAIQWAERTILLGEELGVSEIRIGTTVFSRDSPQMREERAMAESMRTFLEEQSSLWILRYSWSEVIERLLGWRRA